LHLTHGNFLLMEFRAHLAQGTQERRRLRQGATPTYLAQAIFLLMMNILG